MKNSYRFYTDPGHGWLAVPVKDLVELGIVDDITTFSYIKGKTAYLEEDCDVSTFFKAYREKFGKEPETVESPTIYDNGWPGRSYPSYYPVLAWCAVKS